MKFFLPCLLTISLFVSAPAAENPAADGVWLQVGHNQKLDADLPDIQHYKGVMLSKAWSEVEPTPGKFDWADFDKKIAQIAKLGLYWAVRVDGGPLSPLWIYDHGVPRVMTQGHRRDGPYPYYLSPQYITYYNRMVDAFGAHIRSLPANLTEKLVCVPVGTGSTQDEVPYKGKPPDQYALSTDQWTKFRRDVFTEYAKAFQEGPGPVVPLLFNGLMPWSDGGDALHPWVMANVSGGWGHKVATHFYQLNDEADRIKQIVPHIIDRKPDDKDLSFTRCEMDVTWEKPIFQSNVPMNFYWTALSCLNTALNIWHPTSTAREWCHKNNYWQFVDFFNKYAGQTTSATSTGAFCALHEGLDAADTNKFPEDKFGKAAPDNKDRYLAICKAFADRGAKMDSVDGVMHGQAVQRNTQSGFNDAGWNVVTGNYERFLHQIDPDETSIGWWRVGGDITATTPVYARFARSFDHANGKDAMAFALSDNFFGGKPLNGKYPVTVRVVYYDKGTGKWALQYDAVGDPKKAAYEVTNTNSGTWKEKIVTLDDAYLGHRGARGADLTLANLGTEDSPFHMVELTRGSQNPPAQESATPKDAPVK